MKKIVIFLFLMCLIVLCGCTKKQEPVPVPVHSHVFNTKNTDEKYLKAKATCTKLSEYYYSCSCGQKGTNTFTTGTTNEHNYSNKNIDEQYLRMKATCTSPAEYYYSCECGAIGSNTFDFGTTTEHDYSQELPTQNYYAKAATCCKGPEYYYSCICGAKGTETFVVGSGTGQHKIATRIENEYKPESCTWAGWYDLVVYCTNSGCGAESRTTITTPASSHSFGNIVIVINPNTTSSGKGTGIMYCKKCSTGSKEVTLYACSRCNGKGETENTYGKIEKCYSCSGRGYNY